MTCFSWRHDSPFYLPHFRAGLAEARQVGFRRPLHSFRLSPKPFPRRRPAFISAALHCASRPRPRQRRSKSRQLTPPASSTMTGARAAPKAHKAMTPRRLAIAIRRYFSAADSDISPATSALSSSRCRHFKCRFPAHGGRHHPAYAGRARHAVDATAAATFCQLT